MVHIFERIEHRINTEDCFITRPSGTRAIERQPWERRQNQEIAYRPVVTFHYHTGGRLARPIGSSEIVSEHGGDASKHTNRYSRPNFLVMLVDQVGKIIIHV